VAVGVPATAEEAGVMALALVVAVDWAVAVATEMAAVAAVWAVKGQEAAAAMVPAQVAPARGGTCLASGSSCTS